MFEEKSVTEALLDQNFKKILTFQNKEKRKMNPRRKIQGRKTSKKANRLMNSIQFKTNNSVEIEQWERDLADRIFGKRCQEKEVEPTISIPHPEDEDTNEDPNKLVELSETSHIGPELKKSDISGSD